MWSRIFFAAVVALVAIAAVPAAQAQWSSEDSLYFEQFRGMDADRVVDRVWRQVCAENRYAYPDSNLILPGNIIALPIGYIYTAKAEPIGADHMWQAAIFFRDNSILPYLEATASPDTPDTTATTPGEGATTMFPWAFLALLGFLCFVALLILGFRRQSRRPAFMKDPPDFDDAPAREVNRLAAHALERVYGRNFAIVGEVERGVLNGQQVIFFADGSHRTEKYHNEPGFRARLKFADDTEQTVVCRWSCFNPCWSATGARFRGTFTPQGGRPEEINEISEVEAIKIGRNIKLRAEGNGQPAPTAPPEPQPPTQPEPEAEKMHLTKVQISVDKGLNLEGEIPLTVKELKTLIGQVKSQG